MEGIISIDIESRGQLSEEFEENLSRAFELFSISIGTNSLVRFLDDMATFLALNPHPASKWNVKRDDLENVSSNPIHKLNKVEKATILTDQNYYPFIIEEIKRTESSIDICMFFLSMGGNSHPNKKLLDLIIEKHKSGVNVRLILDKDREEDPYGSRIINSKSANYLKKEGIDVRFDQPYRLLHSKFVIFDSKRVVVGSHNWTKGSYFDYDDVSMCIEGEQLVSDFKARFKNLYGL